MGLGQSWAVDSIIEDDDLYIQETSEDEEDEGSAGKRCKAHEVRGTREETTESDGRYMRPRRMDGEEAHAPQQHATPATRRRKTDRSSTEAVGPELVMPLIDASWTPPGPRTKRSRTKELHSRRNTEALTESEIEERSVPARRSDVERVYRDSSNSARQRKRKPAGARVATNENILDIIRAEAMSGLAWAWSWAGFAGSGILRRLVFYAFFLLPFLLIGLWTRSYVTAALDSISGSISRTMSPVCRLPGVPAQYLPFCGRYTSQTQRDSPLEFDRMMELQTKFESVLESSSTGLDLPSDMKRGETALRDLRQRVRFSTLPARNEMMMEFDGFIDTSRTASNDLQRYNSHIGRAVDNVLATTRWTKRVLAAVAQNEASKSALQSLMVDAASWVFGTTPFTETAVLDQYIRHARTVEEEINRLITEAQALLLLLTGMEDRLDVINGIVTRETHEAVSSKAEKLSFLRAFFGHNRGILSQLGQRIELLKDVATYRRTAVEHVTATMLRLQEIAAGLEDLRERVATPRLVRGRSDLPLNVHLESIQSGVERLEASRLNSRKIEGDHLRRLLDRGEPSNDLTIDASAEPRMRIMV